MDVRATSIPEFRLLKPRYFHNSRGHLCRGRTISARPTKSVWSHALLQDNQSLSINRGTVRGLHFQMPPRAQAKLVRVLRGSIYDVAVDLPALAPQPTAVGRRKRLLPLEGEQLFVPRGCAHGFCTLEPDTEVAYKADDYYAPECEQGLCWDDPTLAIDWTVSPADAILSDRDRKLGRFANFMSPFRYDGCDV